MRDLIILCNCSGADIEAKDENSHTPLMTAATNGHIEPFRILLMNEARLDHYDRNRKSIIGLIVEADHVSILVL